MTRRRAPVEAIAAGRQRHREWWTHLGLDPERGLAALPGFDESLRLLVEDEEYSAHDIALMFGVSRQRIHDHCKRLGLRLFYGRRGLFAYRVWDDAAHRFRPVQRGVLQRARDEERREARLRARVDRRHAQWSHAVATLQGLARELGETPTQLQLVRRLFPGRTIGPGAVGATLAAHLLLHREVRAGRLTYRDITARLYAEAGLAPRPAGAHGHVVAQCRCPTCAIQRRTLTPTPTAHA